MTISTTIPSADFRKHLERFIRIDDAAFARVMDYFNVRKIRKGQSLVRPGDLVKNTFWVKKGLLTSSFTDPEGKEHIIQFANEECWVTDQNAFYNHGRATFHIVAVEPSELLCISYDSREKLCAAMHSMEHFFRKKANDSFAKQQQRMLTYLTADARKRYELLLAEHPQLVQRLSKKILASYLGVSRETLSRFKR